MWLSWVTSEGRIMQVNDFDCNMRHARVMIMIVVMTNYRDKHATTVIRKSVEKLAMGIIVINIWTDMYSSVGCATLKMVKVKKGLGCMLCLDWAE